MISLSGFYYRSDYWKCSLIYIHLHEGSKQFSLQGKKRPVFTIFPLDVIETEDT